MKIVFSFLLGALVSADSFAQSDPAAAILMKSEKQVKMLERKTTDLNGTMKATVDFSSDVLGKKANGKSSYVIVVHNGFDVENKPVGTPVYSDSIVSKMMEKEADRRLEMPILLVFDSAFPWERYLASANKKQEFSAKVVSEADSMSGKYCYRLLFEMDAEGDSVSADGKGEIWIDKATSLPVRTYRDFSVDMKRGKAEVKTFSDFGLLQNGIPVLLRSEVQTIPRFLFVGIGFIRITIEQSDFKLE